MPDTQTQYTARHHIRKFLYNYARPSVLAELLEVLEDDEVANPNDIIMLKELLEQM